MFYWFRVLDLSPWSVWTTISWPRRDHFGWYRLMMELKKSVPLRMKLVDSLALSVESRKTWLLFALWSHLIFLFHHDEFLHTNVVHLRTLFNGNAGNNTTKIPRPFLYGPIASSRLHFWCHRVCERPLLYQKWFCAVNWASAMINMWDTWWLSHGPSPTQNSLLLSSRVDDGLVMWNLWMLIL